MKYADYYMHDDRSENRVDNSKRIEWKEYHITRYLATRGYKINKKDRRDEFQKRVIFTKKYYKGRYDRGHAYHMQRLAYDFDTFDKVNMSLDAVIELKKFR